MQIDGNLKKLYNYKGFAKEGVFVGDNGHRLLVQAAGSKANEVISLVNPKWPTLSVARLDMQITVLVGDADSIIRSTTPPPKYRAVRLVNLGERGSTLYVGSPKSRCRLRLYNKTAQLGESRVQDLEKLRIELQLRDDYADRALINMLAGTGDAFFRYYVSKMTDAYIVSIIERAFSNSNMLAMTEVRTEKSDDGRKVWLEHSVIPALMRLAVYDREYYDDFLRRLNELVD
jgi:Replication initiation factor.